MLLVPIGITNRNNAEVIPALDELLNLLDEVIGVRHRRLKVSLDDVQSLRHQ